MDMEGEAREGAYLQERNGEGKRRDRKERKHKRTRERVGEVSVYILCSNVSAKIPGQAASALDVSPRTFRTNHHHDL